MGKRNIIEIAIRMYALYLLVRVPMTLVGIVSAFAMDYSKLVKNPMLYKAWAIASPLLYFLIAMLLLLKSGDIAVFIVGRHEINGEPEEKMPYSELSFWIILLGIYFLVTSVSSIVAELVRTPLYVNDNFMWSILISKCVVAVTAYYMIFRSRKVANFILSGQRKSG